MEIVKERGWSWHAYKISLFNLFALSVLSTCPVVIAWCLGTYFIFVSDINFIHFTCGIWFHQLFCLSKFSRWPALVTGKLSRSASGGSRVRWNILLPSVRKKMIAQEWKFDDTLVFFFLYLMSVLSTSLVRLTWILCRMGFVTVGSIGQKLS